MYKQQTTRSSACLKPSITGLAANKSFTLNYLTYLLKTSQGLSKPHSSPYHLLFQFINPPGPSRLLLLSCSQYMDSPGPCAGFHPLNLGVPLSLLFPILSGALSLTPPLDLVISNQPLHDISSPYLCSVTQYAKVYDIRRLLATGIVLLQRIV